MMTSFLRTFADDPAALQAPMDVAVVISAALQPALVEALHSVFAQRFDGRIHVLIGLDRPVGDLSLIDTACQARPANCAVQVAFPGYSTSVRHGGLCPARDGGVLRCVLSYLANSPYITYLDDNSWWDPRHLDRLRRAVEGHDWAFSLRWFAHPTSRKPICVDQWESVGPGKGIFAEEFGGFVDSSSLLINKLACPDALPCWNYPLPNDETGMSADRRVFSVLRMHQRFAVVDEPTVFRRLDPDNELHRARLLRMGGIYEQAEGDSGVRPPIAAVDVEPVPAPSVTMAAKLMELLHSGDVYTGFTDLLPEDLQGWNSVNPVFPAIVRATKPTVIIDVGVWKGGSTLYLADLLRQYEVDGAIIAVDTFLGSPEHWDHAGPFSQALKKQHGFPLLYRQFLSNVLHGGHGTRVVPLAQSSENAAVILRRIGVRADLIHIDAAHEYEAVRRDLFTYWELLRPGGYLVGDDYTPVWPEVIRAANDFAAELGLSSQFSPPKWLVQKPLSTV